MPELNRFDSRYLIGVEGNYQTYHKNQQDANSLFAKAMEKGYVGLCADKSHLESSYGQVVQSSVVVVVKQKRDGKKVGLARVLRRNGVNETIKCAERLVLPRLKDAIEDAMILFESLEPSEQVGIMGLYFKDAFKYNCQRAMVRSVF